MSTMNEKSHKIIGWAIGSILVAILTASAGYLYYGNQKIVKTAGIFNDKTRLINHNLLEMSGDFGEEVATKLVDGRCEDVNVPEKKRVLKELLDMDKILKYQIVITAFADYSNHNMWVIDENLKKHENDSDFTKYYFSSNMFCETYKNNKDRYNTNIKDIYRKSDAILNLQK